MTKPHISPGAVTPFLAILLFAGMPGFVGYASTVHDLVVVNVDIVDVDAGEIERGTLVVDDGVVSARLPPGADVPAATTRIDGTGRFAIPGLWDMHVHTAEELTGLDAGAVGIGLPLEYMPATTQAEVLEVIRLAARHGAPAHFHMRGWGYDERRVLSYNDLYEVFGVAIATGADVHILHINSSYADWTPIALELIAAARDHGIRVTTAAYPYSFGGCPSGAAYFDDWESYEDEYFETKLQLAETGERLTRERFSAIRKSGKEVPLICHDNTEEMVRLAITSPLTMIASDGGGAPHPRIAGNFSRVLGRYVREEKRLSLMDAIAKMTNVPARHFERRVPALRRKARLQVRADADIVIFDASVIRDRSTVLEPLKPSVGVRHVLVAGVPVVRNGEIQAGVLPGQALRGSAPGVDLDLKSAKEQ